MATGQRRLGSLYIPGFKNNAVLQLIIFTSVAYLMLAISWALVMLVFQGDDGMFKTYFVPNIAMGHISTFKQHFWTPLIYGFFQVPNSFMELLSSMVWLYCFGSVVQMLVGHRQIAPLHIYSLLAGGIIFYLAQLLPGRAGEAPFVFMGARAGIMGMAIAAITLSPNYRFYLSETFSIPLVIVVAVYAFLSIISSGFSVPVLLLTIGGGLTGFFYVQLLRSGYKPGNWMLNISNAIENLVTPAGEKKGKKARTIPLGGRQGISQNRIDEILDKINQKGYNALSKEEKDMLVRAGKE